MEVLILIMANKFLFEMASFAKISISGQKNLANVIILIDAFIN